MTKDNKVLKATAAKMLVAHRPVIFTVACVLLGVTAAGFIKNEYFTFPEPVKWCALSLFIIALMFFAASFICERAKDISARINILFERKPVLGKIAEDYSFRTVVIARASLMGNAALAVFKGVMGAVNSSYWLATLSIYYIVLCLAKYMLLRGERLIKRCKDYRQKQILEWRCYARTGITVIFMQIVLNSLLYLMTMYKTGFVYEGRLVFVVVIYDIICFCTAISFMIRLKKRQSPVIISLRTVSLASSLVSLMSLQTAVLSMVLRGEAAETKRMIITITGAAVSVVLAGLGLYMIIKGKKKINALLRSVNKDALVH